MASVLMLVSWAESIDSLSYYRVLRVPEGAPPAAIKQAFHELAVHCHPDQYQEESREGREAAERIFKAAVEAYSILSNPDLRRRYDVQLKRGDLRLDPSLPEASAAPPPAPDTSVLAMAKTADGKRFAAKADVHIAAKQWEPARVALIDACQREPGNQALQDRLKQLYVDRMQR